MKRLISSLLASLLCVSLGGGPALAQVLRIPADAGISRASAPGRAAVLGPVGAAPALNLLTPLEPGAAALVPGIESPTQAPSAAVEILSADLVESGDGGASIAAAKASAPIDDYRSTPALKVLRRIVDGGMGLGEGTPSYGLGILRPRGPTKPSLPRGVRLDKAPVEPDKAGAVATADRFFLSPDHALKDGSKPFILDADASKPASIEAALRKLVESDPDRFGASNAYGPAGKEMAKVHVELLAGVGDQADTYVAVFRQWKEGKAKDGKPYYLLVDGANLRFNIKVLGGKPVIMAVEGGFAPDIDPAIMTQNFSDEELLQKASDRLKAPSGRTAARKAGSRKANRKVKTKGPADTPKFLTRSITLLDKTWHALSIYQAEDLKGQPIIVAVDVNTGKAWAFKSEDFRDSVFIPRESSFVKTNKTSKSTPRKKAATAPVTVGGASISMTAGPGKDLAGGEASARGTTLTKDGNDHGPTGAMALSNAKIMDEQGNLVTITAEDGSFTVPAKGNQPITLTVSLDGIYSAVTDGDEKNAPLTAKITALPGQSVKVTLNASGDDEELNADVSAYVYSYQLFHWFKTFLGLKDPRLFTPLAGGIHANETSMPGNAFYAPDTDGFYLMQRASLRTRAKGPDGKPRIVTVILENTAQPSIILHELGHRFIQMASRLALSAEQLADPAYRFVKNPMDPIIDGAGNEAFADMVSMFMRNNAELGHGFRINAPVGEPNIIRTGENVTQFDPNDENQNNDPHARGEILMGAGWKSRQGLIKRLGPVQGPLYAALLFVRTILYVQPGDVVSALSHALLADMTTDGRLPNADILRANAKKQGVTLPTAPGKPSA